MVKIEGWTKLKENGCSICFAGQVLRCSNATLVDDSTEMKYFARFGETAVQNHIILVGIYKSGNVHILITDGNLKALNHFEVALSEFDTTNPGTFITSIRKQISITSGNPRYSR